MIFLRRNAGRDTPYLCKRNKKPGIHRDIDLWYNIFAISDSNFFYTRSTTGDSDPAH